MFDKLQDLERHFDDLTTQLADPDIIANRVAYHNLTRAHADLAEVVTTYRHYRAIEKSLAEAQEMTRDPDPDLRAMAQAEVTSLEQELEDLTLRLRRLLVPKDPLDDKNVILEIRAGTGGDEAALFAGSLYAMYQRFSDQQRWKIETLSASPGTVGGYKEIIALISGQQVYSKLKYEAGTHRVQRIPVTESQGRIHTSACTVAVLPEAEDVDIKIDENDLKIDTYRSSGAGGQHVNTTDSAVRITHLPTGIVVTSQDERSQHKNRARGMKVLRSRLLDFESQKRQQERADSRRTMVGSGDRSERIRTYNFPQNRITDHRIGLTVHALDRIMATGDLDEFVDALQSAEQSERLQQETD